MFEKHIKNTKERLLSSFDHEGKFVYLQDLLDNESIEPAYKAYFKAEVAWWIYKEQLLREKNKNFDLDSEDIKSFYKKIDDLYMQTARFDKNNIDKVTENAVKTNLNYLIRPQTTLKWFVFRGELTKNFYEIILRLDYFYHYQYMQNDLISSFGNDVDELEQKIMVTAPEFSDALRQIDGQKLEELDTDGFIELINPIYEFFNLDSELIDSSEIPIEALILFFDDKSLSLLKDNTEKMLFESDIKTISIEVLREMLEKDASDLAQEIQEDDDSISVEAEDLEDELNIPDIEEPKKEEQAEKEYEDDTDQAIEEAPIDSIENDITEGEAADIATKEVTDEDLPDIEEMESDEDEIEITDNIDDSENETEEKDISEEDILDNIDIGDLEEFTEEEAADTTELPDTEEIDDIEEMPLPEDVGDLEDVIPEEEAEEIEENDLPEKEENDEVDEKELEEELLDLEEPDEEVAQQEDKTEDHEDEKLPESEQDTKDDELQGSEIGVAGKKVSGDYLKNIFESTFDMLDESDTEEKADLPEIPGEADKEKVGDIIKRSLDFLKQEMDDFEVNDKPNEVNNEAEKDENSDVEEIDEIEMMKRSLELEDEEESDNEKGSDTGGSEKSPNLAEQIAKKFVEENDKEVEEAPLIDDDTEEMKDFIIEDFEDENDDDKDKKT